MGVGFAFALARRTFNFVWLFLSAVVYVRHVLRRGRYARAGERSSLCAPSRTCYDCCSAA